jgi:hypothetical protein
MSMRSKVFAWRCRRALALLELSRRRQLESDLKAYDTPRVRADLFALLTGCDDDQTLEVREILGRQQLCEGQRWRSVAGLPVGRTT